MDFTDVAAIVDRYRRANVSRVVDPADEMYNSGKDWYFSVGSNGLSCVLNGLILSRLLTVNSILDLPCGHGRVGRHLRAAFPNAHISFCDTNLSGVAFCAETFGGEALPSQPDLTLVTFARAYDVIWIGSLFTHLDLHRTSTWMHHLSQALSPDGILVATFHGAWSIEMQQRYYPMIAAEKWSRILLEYQEVGYGYAPYDDREVPTYGISLTSAPRVVSMAMKIPGVRVLGYTERGWGDNHDVLVIGKTDRLQPWG
jgi:SAM-dependent methyltransferase